MKTKFCDYGRKKKNALFSMNCIHHNLEIPRSEIWTNTVYLSYGKYGYY